MILFMFVMGFGSLNIRDISAATGVNTTLVQNIVAGSLSIEAPASIGFNDLTMAVPLNSLQNLTIVNVRDYRGSGANWTVTGRANNLFTAATGINNIANTYLWWGPGSFFGLDGSSNTGIAMGSPGTFDALRTLINAGTGYGMGNYKVVNTNMKIIFNGRPDQLAGTYQTLLQLTIN